jgi:DNA modification methylase
MIAGDDVPFDPTPILAYFQDVQEQFWWGADYYADLLPDRVKGSWLVWDKRAGIEDMEFNTSHFELCWSRERHLREIIRVKWFGIQGTEQQDIKHRLHPTQKPLQVISFILEKYSKDDDVVVDPYLGSGTTLIACEKAGRVCYGCELEPSYANLALTRWEQLTNQQATLLERAEEAAHA